MSERQPDPQRLDLRSLARTAVPIEGRLAPGSLPRFAESVLPSAGAESAVAWSARGELRAVKGGSQSQLWLHLQARTQVRLLCQRCLQALDETLAVRRSFLFVADEDEAARLDEEIDEDVLVLPRFFDVLQLLEDELILALPIVPRHEACPEPLFDSLFEPPSADLEDAAPHPFAALAALRKPPLPN